MPDTVSLYFKYSFGLLFSIQFLMPFILCIPLDVNETEMVAREGKNVPPIMQKLLTDIAKELISRSTSNSQVVTLNFTNLLILMLLKGLFWGASYAGAVPASNGRNADNEDDEEPIISETEILLLLSYLMGNEEKNYNCLHRMACEVPERAKEYLNAGILIMNAAKFIGLEYSNSTKYDKLLDELQEAVQTKVLGGSCEKKYTCVHDPNENKM